MNNAVKSKIERLLPGFLMQPLFLVLAVMVLYHNVIFRMISVWYETVTYNHCFFVPLISLWLIWQKKPCLSGMKQQSSLWGVMLLFIAGIVMLTGQIAGINLVQQFALVMMIWGVFLSCWGWACCRVIWFALLFLLFMVPAGSELTSLLQTFTADAGVFLLRASGVAAFYDGIHIETTNSHFIVAEACAGLRFLIASLVVAALFAYFSYCLWWKALLFMMFAIALPILGNVIRAWGVMMIAHHTNNALGASVDHLVYGWGFFMVLILMMIWIGGRFADCRDWPIHSRHELSQVTWSHNYLSWSVIVMALVVLSLPSLLHTGLRAQQLRYDDISDKRQVALSVLPTPLLCWAQEVGLPAAISRDWQPHYHQPDMVLRQDYQWQDRVLSLDMAYYHQQTDGHEIIHYANRFDDEDWWLALQHDAVQLPAKGIDKLPSQMRRMRVGVNQNPDKQRLILYWYVVGEQAYGGVMNAKLAELKQLVLLRPNRAALISLSVPLQGDSVDSVTQRVFNWAQSIECDKI